METGIGHVLAQVNSFCVLQVYGSNEKEPFPYLLLVRQSRDYYLTVLSYDL